MTDKVEESSSSHEETPLLIDTEVDQDLAINNINNNETQSSTMTEQERQDIEQLVQVLETHLRQLKNRLSKFTPQHRRRKHWLSRKVTHRLLILSLAWQAMTLMILAVLDSTIPDKQIVNHPLDVPEFLAGVIIMIIFEGLLLLLIVAASVKLAKQLLHHTVTTSFLIQSYSSTILLYTGIYTLIHRIEPTSLEGVATWDKVHSSTYTVTVFVQLLYFSTATMTSTGYGDIHTNVWYMQLIVTSQMLVSVVYAVFILARGVSLLTGDQLLPNSVPNNRSATPSTTDERTSEEDAESLHNGPPMII